MTLRIPTVLFFHSPEKYLEPMPDGFNIEMFNGMTYEWKPDPLFGLWDTAQTPSETIEKGAGDCDDYARLAASYLYYQTDSPIDIYLLGRIGWPPGHIIVSDGVRIFSNGEITRESVEEFKERKGYTASIRSKVR
jgi:hypothetical protein